MNTPDPILGSVIDGRYFVSARIARGGMATVYRATDQRLQRDVALKLIHPHLASQDNFVARFIREARSAAALSSPHIVGVHDQGVAQTPEGERAYLVMELVSGPNLRSQLSELGSLPLGAALDITHQVLDALAVAHKNDIVHRDVKPENILLTGPISTSAVVDQPRVHAKVADFGLARAASDPSSTHTGTMLGTVAYVAPELVSDGKAGPPSDVYSSGIMLYELISGSLPFSGESPLSVAFAHVNQPMPRLTDTADWMPAGIDSLIGLLTAKSPAKRPQNAGAALDALEDIQASIPEEMLIRRIPVFPVAARVEKTQVGASSPDETAALPVPHSTHVMELPRTDDAARQGGFQADPTPGDAGRTTAPRHNTQILEPSASHRVPAPKKQRRRWWIPVLLILLLLAAIAGGLWWYFTEGPGKRVEVPDVTGQPVSAATAELEGLGFSVDETRKFSDDVPEDEVINSSPDAGSQIHPSETITLTVSDGIEMLEVPDVTGQSREDATQALEDARFAAEVTEEYSETVAQGVVIRQDPAAGDVVAHSSPVSIVVSLGRQPIEVPSVVGESQADAVGALKNAALTATVMEAYSDDVDAGLVISQSVAPGESLYRGDAVELTVSLGPELVEVPDVFGMQQSEAARVLEEAGFTVVVEEDPLWGTIFGTVRSQTPGAGSIVEPGTEVTINVV